MSPAKTLIYNHNAPYRPPVDHPDEKCPRCNGTHTDIIVQDDQQLQMDNPLKEFSSGGISEILIPGRRTYRRFWRGSPTIDYEELQQRIQDRELRKTSFPGRTVEVISIFPNLTLLVAAPSKEDMERHQLFPFEISSIPEYDTMSIPPRWHCNSCQMDFGHPIFDYAKIESVSFTMKLKIDANPPAAKSCYLDCLLSTADNTCKVEYWVGDEDLFSISHIITDDQIIDLPKEVWTPMGAYSQIMLNPQQQQNFFDGFKALHFINWNSKHCDFRKQLYSFKWRLCVKFCEPWAIGNGKSILPDYEAGDCFITCQGENLLPPYWNEAVALFRQFDSNQQQWDKLLHLVPKEIHNL